MEHDEMRAAGELATLFIRIGKAIAHGGLPFVDSFYAVLCRAAGKGTVDALLCAMQDHRLPFGDCLTDESFDSCVYCEVSTVGNPGIPHGGDCPVTTDVWPVTPFDVVGELCCNACKEPFSAAEFYVSLPEIRCLPCAAMGTPT